MSAEAGGVLKPCPFCGADPYEDRHGWVTCSSKGCFVSRTYTGTRRWNMRLGDDYPRGWMAGALSAKDIYEGRAVIAATAEGRG